MEKGIGTPENPHAINKYINCETDLTHFENKLTQNRS